MLALLASCAATSAELAREQRWLESCEAIDSELAGDENPLRHALRDASDVRLGIEVLTLDELRAQLGVVPFEMEHGVLLARVRYQVLSAPGTLRLALTEVNTLDLDLTAHVQPSDDQLIALFSPRPAPEASPERSQLEGTLTGLAVDAAGWLLLHKGTSARIDAWRNDLAERGWVARDEATTNAWRAAVDADPPAKAAKDKLASLLAPAKTDSSPGAVVESWTLLAPQGIVGSGRRRGLRMSALSSLEDPAGTCSVDDVLTIELPAGDDLPSRVRALFGGELQPLAKLPVRR